MVRYLPRQSQKSLLISSFIVSAWLLLSCQATSSSMPKSQVAAASIVTIETRSEPQPNSDQTPEPTREGQPPTVTPFPTMTSSPTPFATATSTSTPSPTPIKSCGQRNPGADLFPLITLEYGLSREYVPPDLVDLADYLPTSVTLGYPTRARKIVIQPLLSLISDMQEIGLRPQVISGYRSYASQAIAWSKWLNEAPETAAIVSAPPGHSEHQLGTTFDFGSPELPGIVGEEDIQFHTYFYRTSEGRWLLENAHEYGFTLSYPRETFELTGFYFEPWHYRYVGPELATRLKVENISFFEHLSGIVDPPCIP